MKRKRRKERRKVVEGKEEGRKEKLKYILSDMG